MRLRMVVVVGVVLVLGLMAAVTTASTERRSRADAVEGEAPDGPPEPPDEETSPAAVPVEVVNLPLDPNGHLVVKESGTFRFFRLQDVFVPSDGTVATSEIFTTAGWKTVTVHVRFRDVVAGGVNKFEMLLFQGFRDPDGDFFELDTTGAVSLLFRRMWATVRSPEMRIDFASNLSTPGPPGISGTAEIWVYLSR